jgi:hypothetical protein
LTGASCGLFVAAHVGRANIDLIASAAVVLAMMLYGAAGFYLGIDLPPAPPDHRMHLPLRNGLGSRADAVELLSAAGTFLAAVTAVVSVSGIVLDETAHAVTALLIGLGWAIGATMQIAAGVISRRRRDASAALYQAVPNMLLAGEPRQQLQRVVAFDLHQLRVGEDAAFPQSPDMVDAGSIREIRAEHDLRDRNNG